jgi:hypothetical protein
MTGPLCYIMDCNVTGVIKQAFGVSNYQIGIEIGRYLAQSGDREGGRKNRRRTATPLSNVMDVVPE